MSLVSTCLCFSKSLLIIIIIIIIIILFLFYFIYFTYLFYFIIFVFFFFFFFFYQLIVLLVAASFSTARLYQEIRASKAKGLATEDYSLSRFIGLGRAVGDNAKQFPGIVHMDKRQCTALNQTFMENLFEYLNRSLRLTAADERHICQMGCCQCRSGSSERCGCNCRI